MQMHHFASFFLFIVAMGVYFYQMLINLTRTGKDIGFSPFEFGFTLDVVDCLFCLDKLFSIIFPSVPET